MDPVSAMSSLKRTAVIYERVFGFNPNLSEFCTSGLLDKDMFKTEIQRIQEKLEKCIRNAELSEEDEMVLQEYDATDFLDLAEFCDFEIISDKHHHRKFFNEIENAAVVEYFIEGFKNLWEVDDYGPYFITIYDLNEEVFHFETEEDMLSFINNFDVVPYTAFKMRDNCNESEELWSA